MIQKNGFDLVMIFSRVQGAGRAKNADATARNGVINVEVMRLLYSIVSLPLRPDV